MTILELTFGSMFFFAPEESYLHFFTRFVSHGDFDVALLEFRSIEFDDIEVVLVMGLGREFDVPIDFRHKVSNSFLKWIILKQKGRFLDTCNLKKYVFVDFVVIFVFLEETRLKLVLHLAE